ncbi:MAG: TonB family protein [Steroidobacteraceae bacterium]
MLASDDNGDIENSLSFSFASDIVELVIFTTDEVFLQTLREAVGGARRLWHVPAADKVSDLLLAGQVGILMLDAQSHAEPAGTFVAQIKRQFPDLVVLVAGHRDAETSLAKLISDGIVYRFIHKPMSPARAKLFADAAVKKYEEHRKNMRALPSTALVSAGKRRVLLIAAAVGASLVAALIAMWALQHRSTMEVAAPPASVTAKSPPMDRDSTAPAGPAEVRERLLAQAENALLEERLEEAAVAIEAARRAGVESGRVTFLTSQLAKLREQLKGPVHLKSDSHAAQASAADDRLQRLLSLAAERIRDGRLIDPDHDSARFYVLEALRTDPNANATQAARETLARDLLAESRGAIDHRDFARATSLLDAADGIAAASNLENGRLLLRAARPDADAWDQLLKTAQERLQQDRLIEPAKDSAKDYLMTLRDANPSNAGLAPALQDLGLRLVAKARRALELKQYDVARSWLDEAAAVGFSSADSSAALHELQAAMERQYFLDNAIDASQLTLVKSVKPTYPTKAEQAKTEGWVELDFTVAETGEIEDIAVHAANPPGVFDDAAIGALSHWRYQPVLHDDKPAAQRARIRIRFTLSPVEQPTA